jgi:FSR family fosmidomycin resistance protein-like MFS transporter
MTTPTSSTATAAGPASAAPGTVLQILFSVAFVHLLNDCVQAVLPSIYPLLKQDSSRSASRRSA